MLVQGFEILDCIPQRPPVVMIDKLIYTDHEKAVSGLLVEESNIFSLNGFLSESGLVENIAQTAAAGVGYLCKLENTKVPVGFIASIKDLKIYHLPANGTEIITEVAVTNKILEVNIVKGMVKQGDIIMAECEMRIFVKTD